MFIFIKMDKKALITGVKELITGVLFHNNDLMFQIIGNPYISRSPFL